MRPPPRRSLARPRRLRAGPRVLPRGGRAAEDDEAAGGPSRAERAVARLVGALRLHEAALHARPFSAALALNLAELALAHVVAGKPRDADKARRRRPLVRWFPRPIVRLPSGLTAARAAAGQDPRPAHPGRGRRRRHRRAQARA